MVSFVCNFTFEIVISAKMCDCIIIKLPGKEHKGLASSNLHFKFTFILEGNIGKISKGT